MTIDEAVVMLEAAGLEVSAGSDGLAAAADPREPHEVVANQGVRAVYDFGFGIRKVRSLWFLSHGSRPGPSEEYQRLEDAVARGLSLFAEYQSRTRA